MEAEEMGTFTVPLQVGDPRGRRYEELTVLVDTGASYTVVPARVLERLGVMRAERWPFELADGHTVERDIGRTRVRVNGKRAPTIVVFGEPTDTPVLGAHTLEDVRLAPDPVRRRLIEVPGLLK